MPELPVEVLLGTGFGLLLGSTLAVAVGAIPIVFRYYTGRSPPEVALALLSLCGFGVLGYALGIAQAEADQILRLVIATLVVLMLTLYAGRQGDRLASELPQKTVQTTERKRTLAAEAIDAVDAMGHVTIHTAGDVRDIDGYPPLPPSLRHTLEGDSWRLPVDLPLEELESRLEARLRTTYDLEAVTVSIDPRGRATIAASPVTKGVAAHVPDGCRAVSVTALVSPVLAAGDSVLVETGSECVSGTVVGISTPTETQRGNQERAFPSPPHSHEQCSATGSRTGNFGGYGRVTIAVPTVDAGTLLETERADVIVTPSKNHVLDAFALLERADMITRRLDVDEGVKAGLSDNSLEGRIFAVHPGARRKHEAASGWQFDPAPADVHVGDRAFVIGDRQQFRRLGFEDTRLPTTPVTH